MQVFTYYRVSTSIQTDALKSQKKACLEFAKRNKLRIIDEFVEQESSFKERPILEYMLKRLTKVDGVLVYDLDRLTRDPFEFAKILNIFQVLNKKLFQVTGELNLDKEEDVLLARIKTDVAAYERDVTIKRMKAGIQRFIEEKGYWGRKANPIQKYRFQKYVDGNVLICSKSSLQRIFGVSRPTLIRWMKENGFAHLVKDEPKHLKELRIEQNG